MAQPCCLIAEDEALISLTLEDFLAEVGVAVAGPFASCGKALAWIDRATPDVALSDVKLQDGACTELVKALCGRGMPVIIYSGYPHGQDLPPELHGLPWLEKPTARADLLDAMARTAPSIADTIARRAL